LTEPLPSASHTHAAQLSLPTAARKTNNASAAVIGDGAASPPGAGTGSPHAL
jgi:hypothetical protein